MGTYRVRRVRGGWNAFCGGEGWPDRSNNEVDLVIGGDRQWRVTAGCPMYPVYVHDVYDVFLFWVASENGIQDRP